MLQVSAPVATVAKRKAERSKMTCDYNGWNDSPEEEREWFDQHPEIWSGLSPEMDARPFKVTQTPKARPQH